MDDGEEKIATGSGVGFNKMKNDILPANKVEKYFVLADNMKFEQLLERIPEAHFIVTEEVIKYAEKTLHTELNNHIRVVLTDHISFAIERQKEGIVLKNKLMYEIKVLYREEFEIGLWAINHINETLGIKMPIDEAAFIALYIHTTKLKGGDIHQIVRQTTILNDMVETIKKLLGITFLENDIAYERLITHLHFAMIRSSHNNMHTMDQDMLEMIQAKYQFSFKCATKVAEQLKATHNIELPIEELGYIALHIERLQK